MTLFYLLIALSIVDVCAGTGTSKCLEGILCNQSNAADNNIVDDSTEKGDFDGYLGDDEQDSEHEQGDAITTEQYQRRNSENMRLFEYVRAGDRARVEIILNARADVNATNSAGESVLCLASDHKYPEMVDLLLARKADANQGGFGNRTPLHYAAEGSDPKAVPIIASLVAAYYYY